MTTWLITGANRGIGLEIARQVSRRGDRVIAACRSTSDALSALDVDVLEGVEVGSDESVAEFAGKLEDGSIDVLVNNAGVLRGGSLGELDIEAIRLQFEVNSIGPLRVTSALLPKLAEEAKVGIVTSRMGSISDNDSGGMYGYRMSKAAVNMAGKSLANDLKGRGITVVLLHPGWVRTDMTSHNGLIDVDESARGLVSRLDSIGLEDTGTFWHTNGDPLPW